MNLFRQQKFSIRKFNVGIFSALIATVTFISTNPTTASAAEQNQPAQNQPAQPADANTQPNANAGAQANPTAQPAAPANQGQPAAQPANQGGQANPAGGAAQPNTQPAGQGNQADPNNAAQAQPGNQAAPANQAGQGNNQATPNNNATPANQTQPANAPAAAQPAANAQTQDPNASNTGEGSINTTLTFDDPAISTDENRQDPTVTVTDKVNGYSLINNGKIGFVNSELRRSDMFDKNNPQNYQARGNVAALGRVNANDSTDHGNFNGISKTVNVKPDSELIINFTTMQTNSKQGATNLVIKDAKKNTELATVNVAKTGTAHLFKVPTDADRLDLQFIPDNTAVADASRITTNKDGYKYYSFIDNVGLFSGSHLYVKNRDLAPKATNNKEFTINTEIGNNGNFGASLKADQFKYEVTLPQGVTYVNDSLTTTFPNGNEDSTVLKNMTVNYDQNANKVTFTSQGVTTARGTHTKEVLFPDKSLKLSYKVNVANIDTPKNIDFNEKLTYRTASDVVINNAQPEVTLTADPFSVAVEMNKDALQQQVNSQVDNSHYTTASIAEYNKLKQQADNILNEDANHVETANRASQAAIDGLVTKLQAALIDNQAAIAELDAKAQEKVTAAQQSKKVTQDEVAALVTKINNDKNNAIAEINKQTTSQGVTTEKDNGIAVLEQDVITPTVKPQAKQDIIQAVTTRKQQIKKSNASLQDEKDVANDKIGKIETKAIKDIDAATTNAQVEAIKTKAINDINQTAPATTAKAAALEEFDEVVQAQIDQAPLNPDTTNEEVAEAIERINAAKVSGVKAIEATTTAQDLERVKNEEISKIENITDSTQTKMDAYNDVKQAATARKAQNATVSNATNEEVAEADAAIDGAHSNAEVEAAKNAEIAKIEAIQPATTTKDDAKQAITTKANERKAAIAQTQDITAEEIAAANADVDNAVTQANSNIEAANSQNDVDQAKTTGETSIDQVTPTVNKKATARNEITTILNNKLQAIQATPDATDEEKQAADAEANTENGKANQAISAATTNAQVDEAKANAEVAINAVTPKVVKKQAAKDEIDQLQVAQTSVINNDQNATNEEKEAAIQQLATAVTDAKNNITAATDDNGVDQAKDAGKNSIQSTQPATAVKSNAKNEVDQAVTTQNQAIDNTTGATTEEKNAAKDLVLKAKEKAYQDILNAQTTNDVTQIKDQAVADVQGITADTTIKDVAKDELATKANEQKALIAQTADATTEEKEQANQQVDAQLTQGNQNIENAQSIDDVNTAKDNAIQAIDPIQASTDVKTNARAELLTEMQNKITEILSDNTTTNEEKGKDIEPVRATYEEGLNNINTANTTGDVTTAKDTAVQKVQQLHANPVKKPAGKTALDQAAADRKTQIEQTPNASQQEINDAKQEVDATLNQAKTNVDQSSTNEYVDNAVKEGKAKINAVKTFSEYKKDALAKIEAAYNSKVNEADNSNASTSSEIAEAKQKLAELKQTADQNVNQATSKDDIEVQIHNDLDNINDYTIPTGKKETATTDLYAYADQKKNNISADTNATQDEKQQAIKQVDQNVQTVLESINNGVDNGDVDDALTQGKAAIDAIQVDATVKPKANQAIEAKAEDTKESIDHSDQLTAEEKTEALAMIKQITDQAKKGINDATTTAEVEKAKAQGLEAFDNIQIDSTEKQKAIEELETALDQIEAGVNVDADATTEEKEAFTNALEDILSKATEDISDQTTNAEIATVKNSALEQLKAQRINPEVKKNALEAIREVVNKQIEIIKNADASAKEIARTDLGRYFDRFADNLDKTQTNAEVAELQNVTIPAIEAIVPQNDPDANDTNNGTDNNDATANSNANATPENTGQPNVSETTDNGKADASPTTPNNSDAATGETTATSTNNPSTDDANNKPTANNNSSVDASTDNSATGNGTIDKPEVESTNNGTTDKPATETDNVTPAESTTNNNSTTATNENAPTGSTATAPTTASTEAASSADSKDNAFVNDSKQNAEVNNSAESQSTNGMVVQPKSENKAKAEKDGRDSTNQSMVESTTETLPSADITEPKVPSNTSKDKEESTTNQTDAGHLKSETNVASNEVDKSEGNVDTDVSNKPSTSKPSEAKDKATSTEDSQKADMATADTKDNQAAIGATADVNNKATQNDGANASPATVSNGSNSTNQDMLNVTKTEENKANVKSAQQGKVNKPKQQAKTLPDTGMSHNDDLPYAELALGAGMAFLIRRFTKKDQQTEE
ncbi:SasC/FmtB family protein [Staphylococcus aureus]|uniref:SasC/FmtB family protein n=1 Tax=Staphylococcus aureus TaxID=1280 RepID=UPI00091BB8F1|nr:SasC/FmtB family protein [Staphylococcus aureus]SGS99235.1 FmtB protein [Staphylococcus aureus]